MPDETEKETTWTEYLKTEERKREIVAKLGFDDSTKQIMPVISRHLREGLITNALYYKLIDYPEEFDLNDTMIDQILITPPPILKYRNKIAEKDIVKIIKHIDKDEMLSKEQLEKLGFTKMMINRYNEIFNNEQTIEPKQQNQHDFNEQNVNFDIDFDNYQSDQNQRNYYHQPQQSIPSQQFFQQPFYQMEGLIETQIERYKSDSKETLFDYLSRFLIFVETNKLKDTVAIDILSRKLHPTIYSEIKELRSNKMNISIIEVINYLKQSHYCEGEVLAAVRKFMFSKYDMKQDPNKYVENLKEAMLFMVPNGSDELMKFLILHTLPHELCLKFANNLKIKSTKQLAGALVSHQSKLTDEQMKAKIEPQTNDQIVRSSNINSNQPINHHQFNNNRFRHKYFHNPVNLQNGNFNKNYRGNFTPQYNPRFTNNYQPPRSQQQYNPNYYQNQNQGQRPNFNQNNSFNQRTPFNNSNNYGQRPPFNSNNYNQRPPFNSYNQYNNDQQYRNPNVTCHNCLQSGHLMSACPNRYQNNQHLSNDEKDENVQNT